MTPTMPPSSIENTMMLTWSELVSASRMLVSTNRRKPEAGFPPASIVVPSHTPTISAANTSRTTSARTIAISGGSRLHAVPLTVSTNWRTRWQIPTKQDEKNDFCDPRLHSGRVTSPVVPQR